MDPTNSEASATIARPREVGLPLNNLELGDRGNLLSN
jgi:hypothetical protein